MEPFMLLKPIRNSIFLFAFFSCYFSASSQLSEEYLSYKDKYPDSPIVRLKNEMVTSISLEDNELYIIQEITEEDLYLNESATYGSKRSIDFSSFFELLNFEASSFTYEGGKYRKNKVEEFTKKDELDGSFHDDRQSVNFIYPKLEKGSKSTLNYTEKVNNPRFLTPFYFGDFFPIKHNKVTLIADKDITFRFQEFNTEKLDINFTKSEKRGKNIYTWEIQNLEEYKFESNVPTYKKILPHIVPIITSYKSKDQTISLLDNVSDLYGWYYSLVKDINKEEPNPELVTLTNNLIADKKTDLEKVKAIYYWTQQNIKYIAFEYALGGFIPREANDVFTKKYGDCKDNSSILDEMLRIANLKGHLTWIGTRSIPYSYTEVPTPIVDNHMILSYIDGDKVYFLDATGRYLPIELPSSFIQGKEALISLGEGKYEIKTVPVVEASKNKESDQTFITIENNEIKGKSTIEFTGYKKVNYFNTMENKKSDDDIKDYFNARLQKGNNKFLVEDYKMNNLYSYEDPFTIDYTFSIKDYVKEVGNEIYVNLNLNRELSYFKTEKDREYDIEFVFQQTYDFNTTLEIPEGYTIAYLPENFNVSTNLGNSSITYKVEDNKIHYNHSVELNFLNLNVEQQSKFNDLIKSIEKNYKEVVILKKS